MTRASAAAALAAALSLVCPALGLIQGRTAADSVVLHNVLLQKCPQSCEYAGPNSAAWTTYHKFSELAFCEDTILFTLNVQGSTLDPRIKACSTAGGGPHMQAGAFYGLLQNNVTETPTPEMINKMVVPAETRAKVASQDDSCGATARETTVEVETRWSGRGTSTADKLSAALSQLDKYFRTKADCGPALMFARSNDSIVGAFAGGDLAKSTAADLVARVSKTMTSGGKGLGLPGRFAMQACGSSDDKLAFDTRFGLFADLGGNTSSVQSFLADYVRGVGKCVDLAGLEEGDGRARMPVTILASSFTSNGTASKGGTGRVPMQRRGQCHDIDVHQGDGCASLAQRCGISGNDFMKYNGKTANLCSTLKPKQWVCCSEGDLPDHTPQPGGDGSCFKYVVRDGDSCWSIADSFGINTAKVEEYNQKTFGFAGCSRLQRGQIICLSRGDPPMPAQDPTAVCGPWVVGTQRPPNYDDVAKLNPCPLNACCDVWGQCGITEDFCSSSEIDDHPGTAEPGTNGCISHCGFGLHNDADPPASFSRVAYFEGFNKQRLCLHMDVTQIDFKTYTHIHFAFATVSPDFKVVLAAGTVKEQFDKMVKMDSKGANKILSFGGWSFSTDYDTAPIFAKSVSPANRALFANNVVQFLKDNNLDGLDFDWEYPGATDIPNSVPGSVSDGENYLAFLRDVKSKLPAGKTLSVALPASYWYLRGFPVEKMAKVVDYFIYMTYDLHGQWDHDSKWSNSGCPAGNCLRSHVNITETLNALSMVTKAGARTNQIMVGVSSYARSFKMADPSCTGPLCGFTGTQNVSNAEKGTCTDTAGYISDAEVRSLIVNDEIEEAGVVKTWFDGSSQSDIITWRGNWAAWMDESTKLSRIREMERHNFAGIADWAVDLQEFHDPVDGDTSVGELIPEAPSDCNMIFNSLDDLEGYASGGAIPSYCRSKYLLSIMSKMLDDVIHQYQDTNNDYDGKFQYYAEYINDLVNPQLENWMDNWTTDKKTKQGLGNRFFDCKYKGDGDANYSYQGPCPVPRDIMQDGPPDDPDVFHHSWTIEYTLRDKKGFEDALDTELGIQPDWIKWEDWDNDRYCNPHPTRCFKVHQWHKNFPRKADTIKVQDPKEIWDQALPQIDRLRANFSAAMLSVGLALYDPEYDQEDAAIALAVPVQMLAQAAQNMANVKEIGSKIEEQKKKELILLIVSIVLLVVPFVSEIGFELAGLAAIARFAFIVGELGNSALSIAEIIDDPISAPIAIMGLVLGFGGRGMKSEKAYEKAASARRLMKDVHVGAMGSKYKQIDDRIQTVLRSCSRW